MRKEKFIILKRVLMLMFFSSLMFSLVGCSATSDGSYVGSPNVKDDDSVELKTEGEVCDYILNNNIKQVSYDDFEKVIDSDDDYYVIKAAHECANKLKLPVVAAKNGVYNIYNKNNEGTISIKTSINFNNSTIYIHDESDIVGTAVGKQPIFAIESFDNVISLSSSDVSKLKGKIKKNVAKIDYLAGYGDALVEVINDNKKQFIRYGSNANSGKSQTEVFKIDDNGNILNSIIWDYDDVTSVNIYKSSSNNLNFENGKFVTIADTSVNTGLTGYMFRGIKVRRNKTIIDGITHTVVNSNKEEIKSINYNYYGFLQVYLASDITIKNTNLYALATANSPLNSTYDLIIDKVVNINVDNVKISENQLAGSYWGVMGSNYVKDMTFSNCVLNRIDSHSGVHNLTVSDTIVGDKGFTLIGGGQLKISNTTVKGTQCFIKLRYDYGSLWDGTIEIKNSTLVPTSATNVELISMSVSFDDNLIHYFGYDLVLPNVKVENLRIENNVSSFAIFNNDKTGLLKGDLSKANNYTGGKFKYTIPSSITYSEITSMSDSVKVSKYKIAF